LKMWSLSCWALNKKNNNETHCKIQTNFLTTAVANELRKNLAIVN
jgi:hypothetical protein